MSPETGYRAMTRADLAALVGDLRQAGVAVVAPVEFAPGRSEYRPVDSLDQAALSGPLPRLSLKQLFLPASEPLLSWQYQGSQVSISPAPERFPLRVVLGARPCDAAALTIVDHVMGWNIRDQLWFGRRDATTIIGTACTGYDQTCFCTAMGLGPDATSGADLFLTTDGDSYQIEVVSDKGQALVDQHSRRLRETAPVVDQEYRTVSDYGISAEAVRSWLEAGFEDPLWAEIAMACHGCGACAAVCPTCHCFDINDEPEGVTSGVRRRSWDTCQTPRFTVHASGHNPRPDQSARLRQRLLHKFSIYPSRFGELLCTGCGRCARACPAGIDLPELLTRISRREG
jgi:ferredoxin